MNLKKSLKNVNTHTHIHTQGSVNTQARKAGCSSGHRQVARLPDPNFRREHQLHFTERHQGAERCSNPRLDSRSHHLLPHPTLNGVHTRTQRLRQGYRRRKPCEDPAFPEPGPWARRQVEWAWQGPARRWHSACTGVPLPKAPRQAWHSAFTKHPLFVNQNKSDGDFHFYKKRSKSDNCVQHLFCSEHCRGSVHGNNKSGPTELPGKHSRSSNEVILCSHLVVTMRCYLYQVACRKMDFGICFS